MSPPYPQVPIDEALKMIEELLAANGSMEERTNIPAPQQVELTEHYLRNLLQVSGHLAWADGWGSTLSRKLLPICTWCMWSRYPYTHLHYPQSFGSSMSLTRYVVWQLGPQCTFDQKWHQADHLCLSLIDPHKVLHSLTLPSPAKNCYRGGKVHVRQSQPNLWLHLQNNWTSAPVIHLPGQWFPHRPGEEDALTKTSLSRGNPPWCRATLDTLPTVC